MKHCTATVGYHDIQILLYPSALYDDSCLYIVPESHKNIRTKEQRALSSTMDPAEDPLSMPGAKQVHLKGLLCLQFDQSFLIILLSLT